MPLQDGESGIQPLDSAQAQSNQTWSAAQASVYERNMLWKRHKEREVRAWVPHRVPPSTPRQLSVSANRGRIGIALTTHRAHRLTRCALNWSRKGKLRKKQSALRCTDASLDLPHSRGNPGLDPRLEHARVAQQVSTRIPQALLSATTQVVASSRRQQLMQASAPTPPTAKQLRARSHRRTPRIAVRTQVAHLCARFVQTSHEYPHLAVC